MGLSRQSSMDLRWIRNRNAKKRLPVCATWVSGAYLLNPLKDTYQADDIARDYLHMTLPSYQELFGKETLAAQLAADR